MASIIQIQAGHHILLKAALIGFDISLPAGYSIPVQAEPPSINLHGAARAK